ncbi:M16 family metallopeptidase [Mucisphaera sp.]|uniref:M16 family metallopeptidase n=1 Tax=Mucisphaera sp. TaxID=2913024 RepID=UPI003D0CA810
MSHIQTHRLANGLTVIFEPMTGVESAALTLLVPAGIAAEPEDRQGVAGLLTEMICRGAGGLSSREHVAMLDRLGVQRSTSASIRQMRVGATVVADRLSEAIPPVLDMVLRPNLDEAELEPSRQLAIQTIDGLKDDPQHRVMLELRRLQFPEPLGRSPHGRREDLEAITPDDLRAFWSSRCLPDGAVLAVAGKIEPEALLAQIEGLTADWQGGAEPTPITAAPDPQAHHSREETAQVHIAIGLEAVPEGHPDSWSQRLAVATLSGGMSARLFTEVREKRGLCYSVYASYAGSRDFGAVLAYAGTTPERAPETMEVLSQELVRVHEGVEAGEFARAKTGMKARVVMSGESTGARAAALASDHVVLGAARSLEEIGEQIDAVTLDGLNRFLAENAPGPQRIATIGPEPIPAPATAALSS